VGGLVATLTGVAAAFGLSASGVVLGGLLARWLDTLDFLADGYAPAAWAVFAAVGTVGAGATVAEVAGRRAPRAIVIAGGLAVLGLSEIFVSVETTGAEGIELPVTMVLALAFAGLLGAGAAIRTRRTR
jgi:hypothetical protein